MTFKTVLAGLDLGRSSQPVADFARTFSERLGARLVFLHAEDEAPLGADWVELMYEAERFRREAAHRLMGEHGAKATFVWRKGTPAAALQEEAAERSAELIVVGTGAYGDEAALGTIAQRMLRSITLPLCLVPTHKGAHVAAHGGPIVAPVDLASEDLASLRFVRDLAAHAKVPVVLAHVVKPPKFAAYLGAEGASRVPWLLRQMLDDASTGLRTLAREAGFDEHTMLRVLESDDPAQAIATLGRAVHADLIALPAHAKSALARLFVGSTTEALARNADRPVLVFPPGFGE